MPAHAYKVNVNILRESAAIALSTAIALTALSPAAHAQRAHLVYTGEPVTWTVPRTGFYKITAYGAQGADAKIGNTVGEGGLGAEIGGDFTLTSGETLQVRVGGAGTGNGDGGGASFVVDADNNPLVVAGAGGGGGFSYNGVPFPGGDGLTDPDGGGQYGGKGGQGGAGIKGADGGGAGGGGFLSAGGNSTLGNSSLAATGGAAFPHLTGGAAGGLIWGGSGGGGGYSGGGGGSASPGADGPGGGGGSYDAGTNQILNAGVQSGDGEIIIKAIFVGTPGKRNCHREVVSHLAKRHRDLDAAASALGYSSVQILESDIATYCAG